MKFAPLGGLPDSKDAHADGQRPQGLRLNDQPVSSFLRIVRFNSELSMGTRSPPAKLSVFTGAGAPNVGRARCDAATVGR